MVITDFLERNARLYGSDIALVEVNPSEERDSAVTWREASLIAEAQPDAPYRRELSWRDFDRRANRFANFLLSRNVRRGTKVGILLMNCLEWLPIYFGILKAGCIAVPLNFRYASDEISYCLDLADVEVLVFGPEFVSRLDPIQAGLTRVRLRLFVGRNVPDYAEDCRRLMGFCSSSVPPIALDEDDLIIGYQFVNLGKMTDFIKKGDDPNTAWAKSVGQYGRVDDAAKIIDPRTDKVID